MNIKRTAIWKPILIGVLCGVAVSAPPWELAALILLPLIFFTVFKWPRPVILLLSATVTVIIAALVPVKHLDRTVGPMRYELKSLQELTHALRNDWDIPVAPASSEARTFPVALNITEPMPRRKVLEALARETGGEVQIGYCGTAASILFGGRPSFTYVSIAQPVEEGNAF